MLLSVFNRCLLIRDLILLIILQSMLGNPVKRPAKIDRRMVRELKALADPEDPYDTITGTTMCASDFYEGKFNILIFIFVSLGLKGQHTFFE